MTLLAASRVSGPPDLILWELSLTILWGAFVLCWLALKPLIDALSWSWQALRRGAPPGRPGA